MVIIVDRTTSNKVGLSMTVLFENLIERKRRVRERNVIILELFLNYDKVDIVVVAEQTRHYASLMVRNKIRLVVRNRYFLIV